jgi:phosphinothricin acetyltransferase
MLIRPSTEADLPEIQAIYAHHVLHGTGTFEEIPPAVEEITLRWQKVTGQGWSWLVATDATGVTGYGYFAQYRDRSAYRYAAEDSIYVREDVRGQGVGKALVSALVQAATEAGFRQMIAVIGDSENIGSIGMHSSLGFRKVGVLTSTGLKFGRWIDTVHMQRALGDGDNDVPLGSVMRLA